MQFVRSTPQNVDQHSEHYSQSNFTFIFPSTVDVNVFTHTAGVMRVQGLQLNPASLISTAKHRY
jgi:hypothetical protein